MSTGSLTVPAPLTILSEDEEMFRRAVGDFAHTDVAPRVSEMERSAQYNKDLIPKFAELGLLGIDVPSELGGAGGSFFMSVLAVEELSAVDASAAILVDA